MRAVRALLILALLVIVAIVAFGWWTSSGARHVATGQTGTSGTIDTAAARERGAEAGEKAAEAAEKVKETLAEAALTSKIKAKMALDDSVRARSIDVHTTGSTVTVSGHVGSTAERDRALRLARETAGVTTVVDHVTVDR